MGLPKSSALRQSCALIIIVSTLIICCRSATLDDLASPAFQRTMSRMYDECQRADDGFSICIKGKAIVFLDRFAQVDSISLAEGVKVVRNPVNVTNRIGAGDKNAVFDKDDWETNLPRGLEAKDDAMTDVLLKKAVKVLSDRTIKVELPSFSALDVGRGLEEGNARITHKKLMQNTTINTRIILKKLFKKRFVS